MKNKILIPLSAVCLGVLLGMSGITGRAEASDGEEYITISVAATDDNSGLMYALDTDDPGAFTSNNEFRVPAGTSHTIYVKDSAGNITSQSYDVEGAEEPTRTTQVSSSSDDSEKSKYYEYLTDTPAETGEGTVYDKTVTDGSASDEKVFYTITTAEGDVFYMVMDQGRGTDNVYLLNQVTNSELKSLAVDDTGIQAEKENEQNLLEQLKETPVDETQEEIKTDSSTMDLLKRLAIFGVIGGVLYYYFKVYKKKKNTELDVMDARDMDEFEAEDEEDEVFFDDEYTEEEKEKYLQELIESDDDFEMEEAPWDSKDNENEENCDVAISEDAGFLEEDMEYDPDLDGEEEE